MRLLADPRQAEIEADRAIVAEEGLRGFIPLAWHAIEGSETSYRGNWHIDAMCDHLDAVSKGEIRRLAIAVPPRSMKSITVAIMFPAYDWIKNPWRRFLYSSYAHNLSMRDSTRCRRVIQSPWYQARWGDRYAITSDQNTKVRFDNNKNGYRLSTSVKGQLTGEGGDIICFPYDQTILTESGPVQIGRIVDAREAVRVWSVDVATGHVALKPVVGWHRNPGRAILRVTLGDGTSIRCTADHRLWTLRGWVQAGDLRASDVLPRPALPGGASLHGHRSPVLAEVVAHADVTFCLTVADYHTMVVGSDGYVTAKNCVDDPHNAHQAESEAIRQDTLQWWDEAMSTRLNDQKTGSYIIIQQRVHHNDLLGHVLAKRSPVPWTYLCLPAEFEPDHPNRWFRDPRKEAGELLWPEHVPRPELESIKEALGPYAAAGQLQQRPSPREGGFFKRGWFGFVDVAPSDIRWVRGWDFAATEKQVMKSDPDYTASAKIGYSPSTKLWYVGHIERFREDPDEVERRFIQRAELDGEQVHVQIPQDPGQAGKGQARNMVRLLPKHSVVAATVTGDKMSRAHPWAAKAGAGLVKLVKGDWNEPFLVELTSFPTGGHDDQIDAVSAAFERLLSSSSAIVDYYQQQLRDKGIDPATLSISNPLQAAASATSPGDYQAKMAALMAAMKGTT